MKPKVPLVLAVWTLLVGLVALANPVSAHGPVQESAAQRCFDRHQFGARPVDVAKTTDGQTVLAQTSWNWHDAIGCYLTLDDTALTTLRTAAPPQSLPDAATEASQWCFGRHQFGARPVDVAKTADGQTVLARLSWGYHNTIGCYLILDNTALTTLRSAHTETDATDNPDTTGLVSSEIVDPPQEIQAISDSVPFVWWTAPNITEGSPVTNYTVAYKAKPYDSNTPICPTEIDNTWTVRNTRRTDIRLGGTNLWTDYSVCVKAANDHGDSNWAGVSFCAHSITGTPVRTALNVSCENGYRDQRFLDSDYPAWWFPQDSLRVELHVCVDPELSHLVKAEDLDVMAEIWNEHEASFYSWQSSHLLNMRMEAGRIIKSLHQGQGGTYTNWRSSDVVPSDCLKAVAVQSNTIHYFLVYGHEHVAPLNQILVEGRATINNPLSASYLKHGRIEPGASGGFTWTKLVDSITSMGPSRNNLVNNFLQIINHELDHTLGIRHELNLGFGDTRHYEFVVTDGGPIYVGGFINGEVMLGDLAGARTVYYCYELRRLGWPIGDDKPACVRHPPFHRSSFYAYPSTEGSIEFVWGGSSSALVDEPVTGQRIDLDRWAVQDDGTFGWSLAGSHSLPVDATSYVLPQQPIGLYHATLRLSWPFGDDVFGGTFDISFGPDVEVIPAVDHSTPPNNEDVGIELPLLRWEAAPGANRYLVSGFEGCSLSFQTGSNSGQVHGCGARTENTQIVLGESLSSYPRIIRGKRYDIVIAACYLMVENSFEDQTYEPYEVAWHDRCYKWATVTIDGEV